MLASLLLITALPTASAGADTSLDMATEMGLSVLFGEATSTICDGYMEDEDGNVHQTFVTAFAVDEVHEGDAVYLYPEDEVLEVVWHRTEWAGDAMMSCGSMLGELGIGWVGALVIGEQEGIWYADGSFMPEVELEGDALPVCGTGSDDQADAAASETEGEHGDGFEAADGGTDAADGDATVSSAGCSQVASGGVSGWLAGLFALGLLLRRRAGTA